MPLSIRAEEPSMQRAESERNIRKLIDWAVGPGVHAIPAAARRKTALIVADDIAAAVAARTESEVIKVQEQLLGAGGRPEATIFRGGRPRTDRISAALANSIAGSWCELDEGYRYAPCHGGLYTLPAVLAEAEVLGLTVSELLDIAVLSYEVTARFARCWIFPQMTLHPHPQTAAIGGAIASALSRRYDSKTALDALTAACTLITVGGYEHAVSGAFVRNVWAAVGTTNGMRAADWAHCGIGGMGESPYTVFTELLGQSPTTDYLCAGLGREWAVTNGYHKIHACCQSTHSAVEAALAALASMPPGKTHRDIEEIMLHTHRPAMSNPHPTTTLAAKFSFDHVLATALVHGHARADAFSAQTLADPSISRLRERVILKKFEPALPRPHDRPARITLRLNDGKLVTAECLSARGGPDRPFDEQVIVDKVETIMAVPYPRFASTWKELLTLDPRVLSRRWNSLLEEITAP